MDPPRIHFRKAVVLLWKDAPISRILSDPDLDSLSELGASDASEASEDGDDSDSFISAEFLSTTA